MGKKHRYLPFFFSLFSLCGHEKPALFSSRFSTNFYFGQDFNVLGQQQFDPYSLFQYIFDVTLELEQEPIRETEHSFSLRAQGRMKGIFGNKGSEPPPLQEWDRFQIWMRELCMSYFPTKNKNNFLKFGFFPFKIGNGFVLGNAYDVNIPISWQYVYDQIDQFRPALLLQAGNEKGSVSGLAYGAVIVAEPNPRNPVTTPTLTTLINSTYRNIDTSFVHNGSHNKVAVVQLNIGPFESHAIQLSPYVFFQKTNQYVEFANDATAKIITPGIYGLYRHGILEVKFEGARNFGHQDVKAIDRNIPLQNYGPTNVQLLYDPSAYNLLGTLPDTDFMPSPFSINPDSLVEPYGNGGTFLYTTSPGNTFVFKNSYDRFRNSYYNHYAGYFLYLDLVVTKSRLNWACAFAYASGADSPNDSYATILLTRLTPDVQYKDYDKTYKGFIGSDHLPISGSSSINGLYYGPGAYRYANLAVVGSLLRYVPETALEHLAAQTSVVSYFKPVSPKLNVTDETGATMNTPLPHYLGTEWNWALSYKSAFDFSFSLLGGIFFPGAFMNELKEQLVFLEQQAAPYYPAEPNLNPYIPTGPVQKASFFVSFNLSWLFDSADFETFFSK